MCASKHPANAARLSVQADDKSEDPEDGDMSGGNNDTDEFTCNRRFCDDGPFTSEDALRRHMKKNHPLRCNVCGKAYGLEKRRTKHIRKKHDL